MNITIDENDYFIRVNVNNRFNSIFSKIKLSNLSLFLPEYDIKKTIKNRKKFFKLLNLDYENIINPQLEHFNNFVFKNDESILKIIYPVNRLLFSIFEYRYTNLFKKIEKTDNSNHSVNNILSNIESNIDISEKIFFIEKKIKKSNPLSDAAGTNNKKIIPMITFADCIPVSFFAENKTDKVFFSIHSGWKSTCLNLTNFIIKWVKKKFSFKNNDFIFIIGPAIKGHNYEVKENIFYQKEFLFLIKYLTLLYNNTDNKNKNLYKLKNYISSFPYFNNSSNNLINIYTTIKEKNMFEKNEHLILLYILNNFFSFKKNDKIFFYYKKLFKWLLELENISNILDLDIDTFTDYRFSSYRKDKTNFIAQALVSYLTPYQHI